MGWDGVGGLLNTEDRRLCLQGSGVGAANTDGVPARDLSVLQKYRL